MQKTIIIQCEERRDWLIKAITASIRWYANNPNERKEDKEHLIVLLDTLEDLKKP